MVDSLAAADGVTPHEIHPAKRFLALLDRERARADRVGDEFSLLVFSPPDPYFGRFDFGALTDVLQHRLRVTDEIGWISTGQLGVILPHTPVPGAWIVVNDVFQKLPAESRLPECEVFAYPYPPPDATGTSGSLSTNERLAGRQMTAHPMEMLFARPLPGWKRLLDVAGATSGLVVLAPVLGVVALGVKFTSPGPIFFVQRRSGLAGRPFSMFKFRTMVVDAEARKGELLALNERDGPAFKLARDPRVTWLGGLLRKLSIDELPQLWNVLRGEMSLVGPRPLPCDETAQCRGWERRRLDVTPGLTCIWQVQRQPEVMFRDWMRMDVKYIRSRSLGNDLKLLLRTIVAVVRAQGSH